MDLFMQKLNEYGLVLSTECDLKHTVYQTPVIEDGIPLVTNFFRLLNTTHYVLIGNPELFAKKFRFPAHFSPESSFLDLLIRIEVDAVNSDRLTLLQTHVENFMRSTIVNSIRNYPELFNQLYRQERLKALFGSPSSLEQLVEKIISDTQKVAEDCADRDLLIATYNEFYDAYRSTITKRTDNLEEILS